MSQNRDIYNRPLSPRPSNDGENNGNKTLWIVVGVVLVIAAIGIVYAATQRTIKNTDTSDNTVNLNQNSSDTGTGNGQVLGEQVTAPVTYTGFDVVNLETFPNRVQVRVRGTVSEGCLVAQTPTATLSGKTFTVAMSAAKPKDAVCTQVITNVENVVELPVSGAAAGTYTVKVGALATKTFTLSANNTVQYSGDK